MSEVPDKITLELKNGKTVVFDKCEYTRCLNINDMTVEFTSGTERNRFFAQLHEATRDQTPEELCEQLSEEFPIGCKVEHKEGREYTVLSNVYMSNGIPTAVCMYGEGYTHQLSVTSLEKLEDE